MSVSSKAEEIVSEIELRGEVTFENPVHIKNIIEDILRDFREEVLEEVDVEDNEVT